MCDVVSHVVFDVLCDVGGGGVGDGVCGGVSDGVSGGEVCDKVK